MALQQAVEQSLLGAAKAVEDQLDSEIDKMERMDEDDLEKLRYQPLLGDDRSMMFVNPYL